MWPRAAAALGPQGQGMTVGILGAVELQRCIQEAAAAYTTPVGAQGVPIEQLRLDAVLARVNTVRP